MAKYLQVLYPDLSAPWLATGVVAGLTILHSVSISVGSRFQVYFTVAKVVMMLLIIVLAGLFADGPAATAGIDVVFAQISSGSFATSLVYVSYAYSGWNAATYLAGEIQNPRRNIPIALLGGTALVTALYILINYSFMAMAPVADLVGKLEVGTAAIGHQFGTSVGLWMSGVIALLLVSTISAMTFAGPRLLAALGQDVNGLGWLARKNTYGLPWVGSLMQLGISLLFIWTGTFDQVLVFSGGLLCVFTMITTLSVFRLRYLIKANKLSVSTDPDSGHQFKVWAYPLPPIIFLGLNGYMLYYLAAERPIAVVSSIALVGLGVLVYQFSMRKKTI
jgi:APA family basic amino acid/polyamine antiporter